MEVTKFGNGTEKIAIVGSLHGNELIGKKVISMLAKEKGIGARITAVVANENAIKAYKRYIDTDGNRCFPGRKDGNNEERMAYELLGAIKDCKYVIDIHSTYANMEDTAIITRRASFKLARKVPIKKVVMMGPAIAHGGALVDYQDFAVSIEFSRKRSTQHVLRVLKSTISNILKGRNAAKQDSYLVKGFVIGDGTPAGLKNYRKMRKGSVIAVDNGREILADEDFYPVFFGEKGYRSAYCMKAVKLH